MNNWIYKGQDYIEPSKENVGFCYLITCLINNKKYYGKKLFWKHIVKPPLKNTTKKRKSIVQSDWLNYFGSSEALKNDIELYGYENFKREIIYLCESKSEMSYYEAKLQFDNDVLFRDDFYNGIINLRVKRCKTLKKRVDKDS